MTTINTQITDMLKEQGIAVSTATTAELLEKFKLNWTVSKRPLFLAGEVETPFCGIVRDDINKTFATCKDGYEAFQNSELCELVNEAAGGLGLSVDKGGMFKDGALVYLQLETESVSGLGKNRDVIRKWVSAINSHDGSIALKWGMTNITISCQNSFWHAAKQLHNQAKHTSSMRSKIDLMMRQIESVQLEEKSLYDMFFKFANVPVTKQAIERVTKLTLNVDLDSKPEDISTQALNKMNLFAGAMQNEMKQKGETLWGLFSGVTKFTTHMTQGSPTQREQSKAVGRSNRVDNLVFAELAKMVG